MRAKGTWTHPWEGDVMMRFPDCVWPHISFLTSGYQDELLSSSVASGDEMATALARGASSRAG